MPEYLKLRRSHRSQQLNRILIRRPESFQEAHSNREKRNNNDQNHFRHHLISKPQHQKRCDRHCWNRLCQHDQRIKCLIQMPKPVHQNRHNESNGNPQRKSRKRFHQGHSGIGREGREIFHKSPDHIGRRRKHKFRHRSCSTCSLPHDQNRGDCCQRPDLTGDVL